MYVERLLQINVATLCCLASLLLGMGQRSTAIPVGVLAAAIISVWITDFKGWFQLSKRVAEWAVLALCLPAALRLEKTSLISAVAAFIVLLQVIHMFRRKDLLVYWHLVEFSVLEVVVAALLTQDVLFGVLLLFFLFTALGAMSLLFLHSEWSGLRRRMSPQTVPSVANSRWPLARQRASFSGVVAGKAPLGREFFLRLLGIGLATLAISVLVFFAVPRVGRGAWRGLGGTARATVGFSGRVRLGELGRIIQNPEEVLRVSLRDSATGATHHAENDLYLRGAILTEYRRGEWHPPPGADAVVREEPAEPPPIREAPVHQVIAIEPLDRDELFCVWPFTIVQADARIAYSSPAQRFVRQPEYRSERFTYELGTTAFWHSEQAALVPADDLVDTRPLLQLPVEKGRDPLPGLKSLARQWIDSANLRAANPYLRALALEQQLRASGRFSYSLEGQNRDSSLDPVEDFVTTHPSGHCEYFATARCLMLRSQNIPARMVIGYRTGEFNRVGGFFQVRQLHAHTWVEVYLTPTQIPTELMHERPSWGWFTGGWLRLDATPPAAEQSAAVSLLARIGGLFGELNFAWTNYVVEMDRPRQRQAIYGPLIETFNKISRVLTDPAWWKEAMGRIAGALRLGRLFDGERRWVSWQSLELVFFATLVVLSALGGLRWLRRRWTRSWFRLRGIVPNGLRARIGFYRRFEAILARRGLRRGFSQTPREFALAAGSELARRSGRQRLELLTLLVADAYYLVRFGGAALGESHAQAVEQALAEVERMLAGYPRSSTARATRSKDFL